MNEKLADCPVCEGAGSLYYDDSSRFSRVNCPRGCMLGVPLAIWQERLPRRSAPSREASREALLEVARIALSEGGRLDYMEQPHDGAAERIVDAYLREHPAQPEPIPLTAEDEARLDSLATETPEAWSASLPRVWPEMMTGGYLETPFQERPIVPAQPGPMPEPVKAWRDALLEAMNGKSVVTIHNAAANMLAWINTRWPESEAGR